MGERNAAPAGDGPGAAKQAEGAATGNEKLQDIGQREQEAPNTDVTVERNDGTFAGGKDRHQSSGAGSAGGSKEGHVVETGMPADLVDEDKLQ